MDKAALHAAREIEKCPDARKLGDAVEKSKSARHATSIIHDLAEKKGLFDWLWLTIVLYRHPPRPHSLSYRPQAPRFPTTTSLGTSRKPCAHHIQRPPSRLNSAQRAMHTSSLPSIGCKGIHVLYSQRNDCPPPPTTLALSSKEGMSSSRPVPPSFLNPVQRLQTNVLVYPSECGRDGVAVLLKRVYLIKSCVL
jgi:hypothetical protein